MTLFLQEGRLSLFLQLPDGNLRLLKGWGVRIDFKIGCLEISAAIKKQKTARRSMLGQKLLRRSVGGVRLVGWEFEHFSKVGKELKFINKSMRK